MEKGRNTATTELRIIVMSMRCCGEWARLTQASPRWTCPVCDKGYTLNVRPLEVGYHVAALVDKKVEEDDQPEANC